MKSFAVRCPVPEVHDLLVHIGVAAGYRELPGSHRSAPYFYFSEGATFQLQTYSSTEKVVEHRVCVVTIEEAIDWFRTPREKPINLGNGPLTFPGDGSIKLACGDIISREVCDEINRRRNKGQT